MRIRFALALFTLCVSAFASPLAKRAPAPEDLFAIKDVGDSRLSPDGSQVVYVVTSVERANNNYSSNLWLVPTAGGQAIQLTKGNFSDATPRWAPNGKMIAFSSNRSGKGGLWVMEVASGEPRKVADWPRSNSFLSKAGEMLCWSPDSREIAFVAAELPKETESTDPRVVTRAQYKSRISLSDNLHSHINIALAENGRVRRLTRGNFDEHSIAWSPNGEEIAFVSNREYQPDMNLNYDLFAVNARSAAERRLTSTPGVETSPSWSPDGSSIAYVATKRKLTTIDSVAEDAHVWVIDKQGGTGVEVSAGLDRRAASPQWSEDGSAIYFLAGDHGKTLVYRASRDGGAVAPIVDGPYQLGSLSVAKGALAFTRSDYSSPTEVFTASAAGRQMRQLTAVNKDLIGGLSLVKPENIRFPSFDGTQIEGWLMRPPDLQPGKKCPMILTIHGGPHGMYGYGFNLANQIYVGHGYAVLYLNPRGSSGYGQKFSDGCVGNWGGGDYQDLMKGVDYVLAKYGWLDPNQLGVTGGSYGGFMTNWVITQTDRFKVAVSVASLSNLISFYGTSLYQDLIHAEFGGAPWDNYDLLWKYSPIRYVKSVSTPTMFIHGERDNDVHITQAEEMFEALKRRDIETVFVRYPREGHGNREPAHRLDQLTRTLGWFDRYIKPNVE